MIVEIRPGEGGDDAVQFANELERSFAAYLRGKNINFRVDRTDRIVNLQIDGSDDVLCNFSGVHRIQRIPKNDKKGRRHTSTATVAVLGEVVAQTVVLNDADLREVTKKGSGKGGQRRNKVETCVTLTHLPTGISVTADTRLQETSRRQARAELERRLTEIAQREQRENRNVDRAAQIQSQERSVKQFTHNEQRDESVDHETGRKWKMRNFLKGKF